MPDTTQLESDEPEMESSLHYAPLAQQLRYFDANRQLIPTLNEAAIQAQADCLSAQLKALGIESEN